MPAPLPRSPAHAVRGFLLAALLGAAPLVHAGVFDDDEARKRITETNMRVDQIQHDLDQRLTAIERQLKSQGLVDLYNDVQGLKDDVAKLRGQIEVLTNDLDQQQKRQKDLYVDLDSRLRRLESGTSPGAADAGAGAAGALPAPGSALAPPAGAGAPPPAIAAAPAVPPGAGEQRAYDAALDQFKRGDYAGAITGFTSFVRTYPKSPLASSAQYWIGNAQFARKDFRAAIAAQRTLVTQYPDSSKLPDALLNIASAQSELGDNAAARRTLEDLIAKYPQSDAAQKARQRLALR
ncbi:MAG: tol-pal system protein YbgF [Proteobacteria bacterium]|nr:tol-pal system protein YbgF [Pseudomonadota bacterium]